MVASVDVDGLGGNQFCDCLGDFLGLRFKGQFETAVCPHTSFIIAMRLRFSVTNGH